MMRYSHRRGLLKNRLPVILMSLFLILVSFFVVALRPQPIIPKSISKKVSFTIYVPSDKSYPISKSSIKYLSDNGVLTFSAGVPKSKVSFSEQAIPEAFHDSNQIYPALLSRLNEYSEIETTLGAVALTHPTELKGAQSAVVKTSDTLIFIRPVASFTDEEWKHFISQLERY